jgi:para-nitrobenzyl esterase
MVGDIRPMSARMMASWASSFARNGDPNNPTVPDCKPFKDADRQIMVLNVHSRLIGDP